MRKAKREWSGKAIRWICFARLYGSTLRARSASHLGALPIFAEAVAFVVLAIAIRLGVRGIRLERGLGRVAAYVSLAVLFLWVMAALVVAGINLVHIADGSGSR